MHLYTEELASQQGAILELIATHYAGEMVENLTIHHPSSWSQRQLKLALAELDVLDELLEDLRQVELSTTHYCELTDDTWSTFDPSVFPLFKTMLREW